MTADGPSGARESLVGALLEIEVGPVAHGGHCVARHEGRVVFVRHTLPGERVRARVTEGSSTSRFLRGDAVEVLEPSPHRVSPPCPYAHPGGCGGCDWQHTPPAHSRELKAAVVAEQLRRLAGLEREVEVEPVPGDEDGLRWRTRVEFAVDQGGRAGLHPHRSHAVIPVEDCLIATRAVLDSGVLTTDWAGCSAVDTVAPGGHAPAETVPVPSARAERRGMPVPTVREQVTTAGWSGEFDVGARGFWQVHVGAAATFVEHVLRELDPREGERALDLYSGVGLFAAALADAVGPSGSVQAVESERDAVVHARSNLAGRPQARVRRSRADREVAALARRGSRADLVVFDPPRTGAGRQVVRDVAALCPRLIAYVACDPAALARDLGYAREAGYGIRSLRAFDAFPMTHHVECIAVLEPEERATGRAHPDRTRLA